MDKDHTPGRQQALDNMAKLMAGLTLQPHPLVTVAFDLARAALLKAVRDGSFINEKNPATEITRRMFRAVMDAGFLIMHRDEMQDTILVVAQIKTAMEPLQAEEDAKAKAAGEGGDAG